MSCNAHTLFPSASVSISSPLLFVSYLASVYCKEMAAFFNQYRKNSNSFSHHFWERFTDLWFFLSYGTARSIILSIVWYTESYCWASHYFRSIKFHKHLFATHKYTCISWIISSSNQESTSNQLKITTAFK